jgi:short subunit dehydrogenase-like uncharacterized protein
MTRSTNELVIFGATSFVGQILCRYLMRRHGADGRLKWAIAGRSREKLEKLRDSLGPEASVLPIVVADAADDVALHAMCSDAEVVVSTVGPYALYGEPLVRSCAETGTDYCDLTGEVHWIKRMIERYEHTAKASGARIVHCCGFDSIPSDLGVYFLQEAAVEQFGEPLRRIKMRVKAMRGAASGGTIASMLNVAKEMSANPDLRRQMANPYTLVSGTGAPKVRQPSLSKIGYDEDFTAWQAPFVMAAINTRIVHRSNALSGYSYGSDFTYDEAMLVGRGMRGRMRAYSLAGGLGAFLGAAAFSPTRWLLTRFLPAPGDGPSPDAQAKGFFDFRFHGETADGRSLNARVTGDADPGYGSTGKMLGEAAVCVARDIGKERKAGGFWTPATLMPEDLLRRLEENAGVRFDLMK